MGILIPLLLIAFTCLLIWRACDGFEIASEYLGRNLSEGVRGGTINAIASSIPELLTTLIALFVLDDREAFSVGLGTTAGSALFNGMIIPALCILMVVGRVVRGKTVRAIEVLPKVLLRDGLILILCQIVLVLCLSGTSLYWWQGAILMGLYLGYFAYTILSMAKVDDVETEDTPVASPPIADAGPSRVSVTFYWLSLGPALNLEGIFVRERHRQQIEAETWNAWPLMLVSTTVIGLSCWLLVHACEWLGASSYTLFGAELHGIGMPTMFVAVIFASMATSVPDTVISIRDARDGDYDDAVANALGSNVFDICFALGFPLFLYTLIYGPITMSEEIADQSGKLRMILLLLTILGFVVYYVGRRTIREDGARLVPMGRTKAWLLLLIYGLFAIYIFSYEADWARWISEQLMVLVKSLPAVGG